MKSALLFIAGFVVFAAVSYLFSRVAIFAAYYLACWLGRPKKARKESSHE